VKQIHAKTEVRCQGELFHLLLKCNGSQVQKEFGNIYALNTRAGRGNRTSDNGRQ
jgi:hypothetical protein